MSRFFVNRLHAFDLVFLGYEVFVTVVVLAVRPERTLVYLACHAAVVFMVGLIVFAHGRHDGHFWGIARYWYVVPVTLASFRELHYLIPDVHPFADRRYDRVLAGLDHAVLGDVDALFRSVAWPPLVDVLHLCYWSYFAAMLMTGWVLHVRGDLAHLREYVTVILMGMYLSYLGYLTVPAVGPHHFYEFRPPELDGWILGGAMHRTLMTLEWEMADAFPSGHALMSMIVLVMTWRQDRRLFLWLLGPCLGCVAATVALRYHYVVDVAASIALLPASVWAGRSLHAWRERSVSVSLTRKC